jgi:exopolysaccharide production protein ExoQ
MNDRLASLVPRALYSAVFVLVPLAALAPRLLVILLLASGLLAAVTAVRPGLCWPPPRGWVLPCALAVIGVAAASIAWTPIPGEAALKVFQVLTLLAAAVVLAWVARRLPEERRQGLETAFLGGVVLGVVLLAVEVVFDQPIYRLFHEVAAKGGIGSNTVNRSAVTLALMVWPAALICYRRGWRSLAVALPLAYLAMTTQMTSQSATLGMLLGVPVGVLALRSPHILRTILALVLVAGFVAAPTIANTFYNAGLNEAKWVFKSGRQRVEIWQYTTELIDEAPVLGIGLRGTRAIDHPRRQEVVRSMKKSAKVHHPHNVFLQVRLELGAIGAVFALVFSLSLLAATRRLDRVTQAFALATMASAIGMLSAAFGVWQTWWISAMILAGLALLVADRPDSPEPET